MKNVDTIINKFESTVTELEKFENKAFDRAARIDKALARIYSIVKRITDALYRWADKFTAKAECEKQNLSEQIGKAEQVKDRLKELVK
jgi:archaellum component FlaC